MTLEVHQDGGGSVVPTRLEDPSPSPKARESRRLDKQCLLIEVRVQDLAQYRSDAVEFLCNVPEVRSTTYIRFLIIRAGCLVAHVQAKPIGQARCGFLGPTDRSEKSTLG